MQFSSIIGHKPLVNKLIASYKEGRVAHTQLFLGDDGSGVLPLSIAYTQFLMCHNKLEHDSCGECPSCKKFIKYAHPDLHFYFPTATNASVKKDPKSSLVLDTWRSYLTEKNGYITLNGWLEYLGVGNKQGFIRKDDANEMIGKISLKAYEGSYKVFIIYMVDKMNDSASNKLLKTFEEPPKNTIIILISDSYEQLLPTVRSRAQLVKINKPNNEEIAEALRIRGVEDEKAGNIAKLANGNWNLALSLLENEGDNHFNFTNFRKWLRLCFQPKDYDELLKFNQEISKLGREKLKSFLRYGTEVIHDSILNNNNNGKRIKKAGDELDFTQKFSPFINPANQSQMYKLFNEAIYHVERNAHPGIMLSDMSFKIVDLLNSGKKYNTNN